MATVISIFVPVIYGIFILAADIVFVIVLPQLFCSVFLKWTNSYGAALGYLVGVILRIGAGEPYLNLEPLIHFPYYDVDTGQNFPFRTFAMLTSVCCIVVFSIFTNWIFSYRLFFNKYNLSHEMNVITDNENSPHINSRIRTISDNSIEESFNYILPENRHTKFRNCSENVNNIDMTTDDLLVSQSKDFLLPS